MHIDHDKIINAIRVSNIDIEQLRLEHPELSLRKEEVLGLKFKVGDVVIDEESGEEGEVIASERFRIPEE